MRRPFSHSGIASLALASALVAGLSGCATSPGYGNPSGMPQQGSAYPSYPSYPSGSYPSSGAPGVVTAPGYVEYGRVIGVELVRTQQPGQASGAGVVIGGIAGGVLGRQIGGGSGRDLATIAGVAGGALAGNAIEKNAQTATRDSYRVSVQVDNGTNRAYDMASAGDLRVGDRVRIENGQLYRY